MLKYLWYQKVFYASSKLLFLNIRMSLDRKLTTVVKSSPKLVIPLLKGVHTIHDFKNVPDAQNKKYLVRLNHSK